MDNNPSTVKKKRVGIGNVAALLMATALAGQLLGFLRTKLVNANFPLTGPHSTDAYFAAFSIPSCRRVRREIPRPTAHDDDCYDKSDNCLRIHIPLVNC